MRIALVTRSLATGGSERQLVNLAIGLHQRGHAVSVISFYPGGGFTDALRSEGVPLIALGKSGRWDVLAFSRKLRAVLRSVRPDVIYSFLPIANLAAAVARVRMSPRPALVWGVRAASVRLSHYDKVMWLTYALERRFSFVPDLIIANSAAAQAEWHPVRTVLVPNGIDTTRFVIDRDARRSERESLGIAADDVLVGRVGRLDPMKDHGTFLRAAALVRKTNPNARFIVVGSGDGDYERKMKELASGLGLERSLMWVAQRSDMPSVYNALDVFVSSSESGEGFPNVIAEAMACGVICVVTDVGDSRRIVDDPTLVVPARSPEQLALALDRVIRSDRSTAAESRRERIVSLYSIPAMVERTESLLLQFGTSS